MALYERRGRLADAVQDAIRPAQVITWLREDDQPHNLIGATLSGTIRNKSVARALAGTLTVTDTDEGQFRWDYDAADLVEAGTFYVQFEAVYADVRTPARSYDALWVVR